MNIEELMEKFPKAFEHADISFPDGWKQIIEDCLTMMLYRSMWYDKSKDDLDAVQGNYIEIHQIKEKFGSLRVYFSIANDPCDYRGNSISDRLLNETYGVVKFAEYLAGKSCQVCGEHGTLRTTRPYIETLCDEHDRIRSSPT